MKFFVKSIIFILAGTTFCTALLSFLVPIPLSTIKPLSTGFFLALIFVSTGFITFLVARKFEQKEFTLIVSGTSIGRMILLLATILLFVRFSHYDAKIITVSLLCFYFIFQIIEVIGFTKINPKESQI